MYINCSLSHEPLLSYLFLLIDCLHSPQVKHHLYFGLYLQGTRFHHPLFPLLTTSLRSAGMCKSRSDLSFMYPIALEIRSAVFRVSRTTLATPFSSSEEETKPTPTAATTSFEESRIGTAMPVIPSIASPSSTQ